MGGRGVQKCANPHQAGKRMVRSAWSGCADVAELLSWCNFFFLARHFVYSDIPRSIAQKGHSAQGTKCSRQNYCNVF